MSYEQFKAESVKSASKLNIVDLTEDQWGALKQFHKQPATYGRNYQFYESEALLIASSKRITLNGAPLRASTDIAKQVVGKVPSGAEKGNLVILSASVMGRAGIVAGGAGSPVIRSDL